jgi:hypothetical protein
MFPFSNRSSRSSSAHSLSNLLEEQERQLPFDVNAIEPSRGDFASPENLMDGQPPDLSEDNTLNPGIQYAFTQNHPMGKILLSLLRDTCNLAKKTNVKEMESEVNEMCTNFFNAMRMGKSSTSRQIKQSSADLESHLIDKELNSHLLNENTDPPKYFSPIPTLHTPHHRSEAMKLFPTRNAKFSGQSHRDNGMDIVEFLSMIKTAQEYCQLSEKEFKEFLLLSTTGRAHTLLNEWINLQETIPTIFHNLLMHYDRRLSPESTKELLYTYKAPKNLQLREVETNIMLWASRAATLLPAGPSRIAFYNMEIVQTLIRCLPPTSSAIVQGVFNSLSARLGRAALATELSRALNLQRHSIDTDIRMHGIDQNRRIKPANNKATRVRKYTSFSVATNNHKSPQPKTVYPQRNAYNTASRNTSSNRTVHPRNNRNQGSSYPRNQANAQRNPNKRSSFKPNSRRLANNKPANYCSLCGRKDHTSTSGCPFMVSDSGSKMAVMPTYGTCSLCPARINPRLNHPPHFCPFRKGGPFNGSN